ncbi:MAG: MarR family winged helix-turn-helix transcriptional regulator [Desulfovibrio sp.]|uniref:MarR family winged helix-turn-helix transcriptional regulator n=1 Tax=Desulfovibrio sp. 7SRBS1 TaxID=3378064 RepID=UPI003B3DEC08
MTEKDKELQLHKNRPVSFGYRVAVLARLQAQIMTPRVEALGLSYCGVPIMAELYFLEREVTQDELVTRLLLDKAAVARTLGDLEKRGLVRRRVNPDNRRQKLVAPSEEGWKLHEQLCSELRSMSSVLADGFTDDERELALQLLDRMIINGMRYKNAMQDV